LYPTEKERIKMTAINSKRKTEKRKTLDMTQLRKHKWHFQEAWMHIEKIKGHLDSMTKNNENT
jgi:hypothetical protein